MVELKIEQRFKNFDLITLKLRYVVSIFDKVPESIVSRT